MILDGFLDVISALSFSRCDSWKFGSFVFVHIMIFGGGHNVIFFWAIFSLVTGISIILEYDSHTVVIYCIIYICYMHILL